jgi:hypothetical protein
MKRSAVQVAVIALLASAAIVAVAGTVDDVRTDGGSGSSAPPEVTETTTAEQTTQQPSTGTETTRERLLEGNGQDCIEVLQEPLVIFGIVAGWGLVVAYVYTQYGQLEAVSAFMLICVVLFLVYPMLAICEPPSQESPENRSGGEPEERNDSEDSGDGDTGGDGGEEDGRTIPDLPLAVLAILGILAAAAVGGVLVTRKDDDGDDPFDSDAETLEETAAEVDVDEFAAAAGRAADRIERTDDVDNEIYRAWVEMTEYLEVDHPETSTPGEFAAAAVDAGIDREDVVELTGLFERVRYGSEAATADREARALDALRRIDDQYGGEDA